MHSGHEAELEQGATKSGEASAYGLLVTTIRLRSARRGWEFPRLFTNFGFLGLACRSSCCLVGCALVKAKPREVQPLHRVSNSLATQAYQLRFFKSALLARICV